VEEQAPRVTDKRGQKKEHVVPIPDEERAAIEEAIAEQGRLAQEEAASEPALRVTSFILLTLNSDGSMRLFHQLPEMQQLMGQGIQTEREANPADIANMASQLNLAIVGNEVTGRVMQALAQQAQQVVQSKMGGKNGLVDPRIAQAAQHRA
jgi:hypothetical protein